MSNDPELHNAKLIRPSDAFEGSPDFSPRPSLVFSVREMLAADIPAAMSLLSSTPGVALKDWENVQVFERAILRNPGMNLVAVGYDGAFLGVSLAGDTGFRVSFHHVTVREGYRRSKIAEQMVQQTLDKFRTISILRIINIVENDNEGAISFWQKQGFRISTARGGVTIQMTIDLTPRQTNPPAEVL